MIQNLLKGMALAGAIALGSCSTQNKLASATNDANDDVYYTKAKAGDEPVYAVRQNTNQQDNAYYDDDDYGYYDSYAARLNRFYDGPYLSSYYDGLYYGGYTPYYSGYGLGFGLGYGYFGGGYFGYDPFSYYGYNPYFGYSNYGYYGSTIGYGYSPYWGATSYYNVARTYGTARPYRGSGFPATGTRNTLTGVAVTGNRGQSYYPTSTGRPGSSNTNSNGRQVYSGRPQRDNGQTYQPQQPRPQVQSQPTYSAPASSGGGGGGGERSNGNTRPGGRP